MPDYQTAKNLLSKMRLKLTEEELKSLAGIMDMYREWNAAEHDPRLTKLTKSESIKKSAQLQGALSKAKRLYAELHNDSVDILEDAPQIDAVRVSRGEITFTRNAEHEELLYLRKAGDTDCSYLWPLQIFDHFEKWAAELEGYCGLVPAWNAGTAYQRSIERMASHCWRLGIKASAADNSQFYKIAAFVVPEVTDLSYRIKKMLGSDWAEETLTEDKFNKRLDDKKIPRNRIGSSK